MYPESWTPLLEPTIGFNERLSFTTAGDGGNPFVAWYAARLQETLARQGHIHRPSSPARDLDNWRGDIRDDPRKKWRRRPRA